MPFSKLVRKVKSEFVFYKGLIKDTEGASGIEYAIIVAMVALVIVGAGTGLGDKIKSIFDSVATKMTT